MCKLTYSWQRSNDPLTQGKRARKFTPSLKIHDIFIFIAPAGKCFSNYLTSVPLEVMEYGYGTEVNQFTYIRWLEPKLGYEPLDEFNLMSNDIHFIWIGTQGYRSNFTQSPTLNLLFFLKTYIHLSLSCC